MSEENQEAAAEGEAPAADTTDAEARAGRQGWVAKDEWKGAPEKWRDAEAFNAVGDQENAVLKERNASLDMKIQEMSATLTEAKTTLKDFKVYHENVGQRAYKRAMKDVQVKAREAVREGDVDAYDAAQREAQQVANEAAETVKKGASRPPDPEFVAWKADNSWYEGDVRLTKEADAIAPVVSRMFPSLKGRAFYEKVGEEIKAQFADKFENPRRQKAAAVGGAGETVHKQGGKSFADLPSEAKTACDRFVKQGLISNRAQYVKEFEWE